MAGKPEQQRRLALLSEPDNAEFILELAEQGESLQRISMRLTDKLQEPISYAMLSRWAQQPGNAELVARARTRAADAKAETVVDRSSELVRNVALGLMGRDDIAAARVANDADQWIAGVWNRPKYAQQNGVSVAVNIGAVHLDSLRQGAVLLPSRPPELLAFDQGVTDVEPLMLGTTGHLTLDDLI